MATLFRMATLSEEDFQSKQLHHFSFASLLNMTTKGVRADTTLERFCPKRKELENKKLDSFVKKNMVENHASELQIRGVSKIIQR